jgi:hypothetical protein
MYTLSIYVKMLYENFNKALTVFSLIYRVIQIKKPVLKSTGFHSGGAAGSRTLVQTHPP